MACLRVIGTRRRNMYIGLCLFLAERPFRLGHLEISCGICSKRGLISFYWNADGLVDTDAVAKCGR